MLTYRPRIVKEFLEMSIDLILNRIYTRNVFYPTVQGVIHEEK